ncbi:putative O-methyltransferase [Biscogniauxia marginata]|nr:putative O-methyltransferase [Biscogniauxia marginata]
MESKQVVSPGPFTRLALEILGLASELDKQLASQSREPTSFWVDTLENLPAETNATREKFINKTHDAKRLALGARGTLWELGFQFTDEMTLRAIYDFRLAQHVPLQGSATFDEVSQASKLDVLTVERILRQAMASHIFSEAPGSPPGRVVHTAISRLLATDSDAFDSVGMIVHELAPICERLNDALRAQRDLPVDQRDEPTQAATAMVHGAGSTMFGVLGRDAARAARFGAGMRHFTRGVGWDVSHLVNEPVWAALDVPGAVLVDVGGSSGAVSCALAADTRHLRFVVQDLPDPAASGAGALPHALASRVAFEVHDFFEPQTRRGVDAFLLRWVLHNWSDKYALRILRALVPGMKHGTRVIINEYVLVDGPETRLSRKQHRNLDLVMLAVWNSPERTVAMWRELIEAVDPRLQFLGARQPEGSLLGVIEAVWN